MAKATEMLYRCADMGAFAAARPPAAAPDQRWVYSSGSSNVLADVLYTRVSSSPEAMHHLAYDEFFNRLGITTAVFEHDESDAFVGSSYHYMSCLLYTSFEDDRCRYTDTIKFKIRYCPNSIGQLLNVSTRSGVIWKAV